METKWCFWCDTRKDRKDFYRDRRQEDGHSPKCKSCTDEYRKEYRKTDRGRAAQKRKTEKYRKKNPHKLNTHTTVYRAIKTGKLKRLECEFCDTEEKAQGHHGDYNKPLDVMWLCPLCHTRWHKALKMINFYGLQLEPTPIKRRLNKHK